MLAIGTILSYLAPSALLEIFRLTIGSVFSIFSSTFSIVDTTLKSISPIIQGVSTFAIWYIRTFFEGLKVIIQHMETLAVIFVFILASAFIVHSWDNKHIQQPQRDVIISKPIASKVTNKSKGHRTESPKPRSTQKPINPFDFPNLFN